MDAIYIIFIIVLIAVAVISNLNKIKGTGSSDQEQKEKDPKELDPEYIKAAYQQKWMFTLNEKNSLYALEKIVKEEGYRLFAKVRLFDLVTPITKHPKYKSNLWRIQAKHLDFVITTDNLVAKYVIELDDSSHDKADRKQRDEFVDMVLQACGYKVLHVRGIQEDVIRAFLKSTKVQQTNEQE